MAIQLGPRSRTVLRYAGITLLGLFTFVFALQASLPVQRAKQKIIETLAPKYDVTIGSVERGFVPGRVYLKDVTLRTRPSKPEEVPTTFFIPKLRVDVGLFAALHKNLSIDFDASLGAGDLGGNITLEGFGKKGLDVHVHGSDMPGDSLPLRGIIGLPMTGKLDVDVALDLPYENRGGKIVANWAKGEGTFQFGCPGGCTFGDGKSKLKPILKNQTSQVMVGEGIDFGKVNIDSLVARADMKDGKLTLSKFDLKSQDGEVHLDYEMKLAPDLAQSMVTGCVRFKGSQALLKRDQKTFDAINLSGAELRGDGLFHITLTGPLGEMKRLNQECGPNVVHGPSEPHVQVRPTLITPPVVRPNPPPPPVPAPPPQPPAEPEPAPGSGEKGMAHPPGPEGEVHAPEGSAVPEGSGENTGSGSARPGEVLQ